MSENIAKAPHAQEEPIPEPADRDRPDPRRIAVVEELAMVAETIGMMVARSTPCTPVLVPVRATSGAADIADAVLLARAGMAIVSLSQTGLFDPLELVESLCAHGTAVVVTGPAVDEAAVPSYLAAGALAAGRHQDVREIVGVLEACVPRDATTRPAGGELRPGERA